MPLGTQLKRPGSNSKQELEIAVKMCASLRGSVAVGNMQKAFSLGEFNEQASPESRLPLYGKARKFVGFVPWFRGCPLCCTVVFRTVGRRSNCIFVLVFNSSGEYFGVRGSSWSHCWLENSGQAGEQKELPSPSL